MIPRAQDGSPRILVIHPSPPFSLRENWLPILERMRTDWYGAVRDLTPSVDVFIRPLLSMA